MTERMRRQVTFNGNTVALDGTTYTLEGVQAETVWTLALEGLVARLKRAADPGETYKYIALQGITPQRKKNAWVEALAVATQTTYDGALAIW